MELLSITLAANETKQFAKAGRYFEIIDANFPISVQLIGANTSSNDTLKNALSGLFIENPYSHFAITNGSYDQTITVLLMENGRGGSRRQPGVALVNNADTVTLNSISFDAVDTASAAAAGFQVVRTITFPVTNAKGIRLHSFRLTAQANAAGTTDLRLLSAPSAPTTLTGPGNCWTGAQVLSANGAVVTDVQQRMNVLLPPAWGLYLVASNSGTTPPQLVSSSICYELIY